jgi:hypothetical protein
MNTSVELAAFSFILKMEETGLSETLVYSYQAT